MADNTNIEWSDATWNPITGCSVISPGCTNCYAMRLAGTRMKNHWSRTGLTSDSKAGPVWNGQVRFNEEWLLQPLSWKRPRMIFVCAHADLFHDSVPDEWIDRVFAVMALAPQHTFQVLTKRSERMRKWAIDRFTNGCRGAIEHRARQIAREANIHIPAGRTLASPKPFPHIWLGVSVEDQKRADKRIPDLLATPAAVPWVSAEPLLGELRLDQLHVRDDSGVYGATVPALALLSWVVAGGESGKDARPMRPDWARSLRDQCKAAGVPFLFKQWGDWREAQPGDEFDTSKGRAQKIPAFIVAHDGTVHCFVNEAVDKRARVMLQVGKKRAGRLLDGVEHNEFPR